jgi:hypothetical protein
MMRTARRMNLALVALVAAGALTVACGGGGDDDGGDDVASLDEGSSEEESAQSDEEAQEEDLLDWVECMRGEGVEIPDPTRDEDGNLVIGGGVGVGGGGPGGGEEPVDQGAMDAATETCGPPPQVGGQYTDDPETRQAIEDAAFEFARCMRDEGIEDFPDPDFSNNGPGGEARTDSGGDGSSVALGPFGDVDMDDPEIAAAFEVCQDLMQPEGLDEPGGTDSSDEASEG